MLKKTEKSRFKVLIFCLAAFLLTGCTQPSAPFDAASGAADGYVYNSVLTEDRVVAWALGCSAIFAVRNGYDPNEFGMFVKNDYNAIIAKSIIYESWGCSRHDSLVSAILALVDHGDNTSFVALYNIVAPMTDKELDRLAASSGMSDPFTLRQTKELGGKWGDKQLKAWDWFRAIQITGWGYIAGYLNREEAYSLMKPVIEQLRSTFSSWDDANDNYMDGFAWTSGADPSDYLSSREYNKRMSIYEDLKAYPQEITLFDPTLWPDYKPGMQDGDVTADNWPVANYEYQDNGDGTCTITGYKWERGDIDIPEEIDGLKVTEIGEDAFYDAKGFNGVLTIPDTVKSIDECAFRGCSGLTGSLTIPDTLETIGNNAFLSCSGLTGSLIIPDSVTTIGYQAFSECSGFTGDLTLSRNVKDIGERAFNSCNGFSGKLTIPEGVETIGESAFSGCGRFSGNLEFPESLTKIGGGAFFRCAGFTGTVVIPENLTGFSPISIFQDCSGLESVEVASQNTESTSVDGIVYSKDKSVLIYAPPGMKQNDFFIPEGTKEIGSSAFEGCTGFAGTLTIPDSVTNIGISAFEGCSQLEAVTIPNSVTHISRDAFKACGEIKTVTIPSGITTLNGGLFSDCSRLSAAVFLGNAPADVSNGVFLNCASDFKILYNPAKSGWDTPEWRGYPCYPKLSN